MKSFLESSSIGTGTPPSVSVIGQSAEILAERGNRRLLRFSFIEIVEADTRPFTEGMGLVFDNNNIAKSNKIGYTDHYETRFFQRGSRTGKSGPFRTESHSPPGAGSCGCYVGFILHRTTGRSQRRKQSLRRVPVTLDWTLRYGPFSLAHPAGIAPPYGTHANSLEERKLNHQLTADDIANLVAATEAGAVQWYLLPDNGRTVSAEACSKDIKTAMASKTHTVSLDATIGSWGIRLSRCIEIETKWWFDDEYSCRFSYDLHGYTGTVCRERNPAVTVSATPKDTSVPALLERLYSVAIAGSKPWKDSLLPTENACFGNFRTSIADMASQGGNSGTAMGTRPDAS